MKKIIVCVLVMLMVTGCGMNSASNAVTKYLKKYKTLDSEVLVDLESVIEKENLDEGEQDKYREVLKKQYKDLEFEIVDEEYDEEVGYVTVKIKVYDLYQAQKDATVYLENHRDEFNDENGVYDQDKFTSYKLDKMQNMNDKIEYTIIFTVNKEDDKYVVVQPTDNDLEKIHGIYNPNLD